MKSAVKVVFKVLKIFLMVILSLIMIVNVYLIFSKFVLKEELPSFLGYSSATVISGSMADAINVGDLVIAKELKNTDDYKPGDIIIYYTGKSFVTHRIVQREGNSIVTQGDANNVTDDAIDVSQVRGRIVKIIPGLGNIIEPVRNPVVLVLVILIIFLVFEAISVLGRNKKQKTEE